MKSFFCFLISAVLCMPSWSQLVSYDLSAIPDSLKKNAAVVTQYENISVNVDALDDVTYHVRRIYTVLNDDGRDELIFSVHTSKYVGLDDAEIKVYDATGRQLSKHKKKDMSMLSVGEGLIEDGHVVYYTISHSSFPITVDLDFQLKIKGTLGFPSYHILIPETGVLQSSFTATVPSAIDLRYKEVNTQLKPNITDDGKKKTYTWQVKNLKPVNPEPGCANSAYIYPSVKLAPNSFSYYGYKGDLSSWKSYGLWAAQLYSGLDELPDDRKLFFRELVKEAKTDKEKTKIIYDYLQKNFRYVSIQLGIGGMRPFSADFTDKKKYGDCKGLSNYMKAALKAVGINSNIAIINSGYNSLPVDPAFPADEFDHVILCVPQKNDSIWLECTSSTIDFGVLSTFTENRYALLITENGGALVPTPQSNPASNFQSVKTIVELDAEGSGITQTTFNSTGYFKEYIDDVIKSKKEEQKEQIVLSMSYKQPDDFEFGKTNSADGRFAELKMSIEKIPDFKAGNKLFLSPRLYKIWTRKLPKAEDRKHDYYFRFPFFQTDTTIYKLPAGYKPDALPPSKEMTTEYACYSTKYWYEENEKSVYSTISISLKKHIIPAAKFSDVKKVFDEIMLTDGQKIVIKKED